MSAARLSRTAAAPPVRMVHLGLGNFFRAHQARYTAASPDAGEWGIAAFTGRSSALADALTAQQGRYTLVTRAADGDTCEVIDSVVAAHPGTDLDTWYDYLTRPEVRIVTLTVTEAAYLRGPDGGLDATRTDVRTDLAAMRSDPRAAVATVPARLAAGLSARRAAGAGPITVVSCDNLPDNGAVTARVVADLAGLLDPTLPGWVRDTVSFVTTMVDRITPATTEDDIRSVAEQTGLADAAPVVTEPYSEWVLSGEFPVGRPAWEAAGARFVTDVIPYERRKLWLLNGGHSLLAYAGSARGHDTVAQAVADPHCRRWLQQWWDEAARHLRLPDDEVTAYRTALLERWSNARIQHRLAQIAADGSLKLPVRILPVLRAERAAGRMPTGAVRALAAWIAHLRGTGAPVNDAAADAVLGAAGGRPAEATGRVLALLDADLATDDALLAELAGMVGKR
ncbi:mannitol dehydrogenase family protein [Paractinoplanes rishiriensis]|uniref:Mannitol-1-phosphate 5-dehydrogenase n=1 Tax=Paractinoplanes rishiriensis TaxID=1050105 RepID=A0A919K7N1_9ACTN|nr:mannitol dehydrogenase family protein [Actinoplanes rishiriensis]GIF00878.1 mannitol-1-phosphate 5-dehydrogenase [Actinoplanes rishiriensis]